jgi:8-oxo-dGTP diphosphatase/putative hydrolase of the HAD superfamily
MRNYEWIFFDLGSTLVDERKVYERHMKEIANKACVSYEEVYEKAVSLYKEGKRGYSEMMKLLGVERPVWTLEDEILYPDANNCLKELKKKKYQIGIIANQLPGTEERLIKFGIRQYIDLIVASAEVGVSKPDKKIFELALERANCNPQKTMMVGDRVDNDIVPAKSMGMGTVWLKQGFGQYWIVKNESEKADYEVESLSDLLIVL